MMQLHEQGGAQASPTFDPGAWLHTLVQIGGGYMLTSGRKLWLIVRDCSADDLSIVMAQIVGHPDRVENVRTLIERRQFGEAT